MTKTCDQGKDGEEHDSLEGSASQSMTIAGRVFCFDCLISWFVTRGSQGLHYHHWCPSCRHWVPKKVCQ